MPSQASDDVGQLKV